MEVSGGEMTEVWGGWERQGPVFIPPVSIIVVQPEPCHQAHTVMTFFNSFSILWLYNRWEIAFAVQQVNKFICRVQQSQTAC